MTVWMKTNAWSACAVFIYMQFCLKKHKKKTPLRISPKCWCFPIVVMSRNELGNGVAVDTGWFQMLWRHLNAIYGKEYKLRVWWAVTYVILVCDWKKWNRGGGTRCEESGSIEGQSQCEIWSCEYWLGVYLPHGP